MSADELAAMNDTGDEAELLARVAGDDDEADGLATTRMRPTMALRLSKNPPRSLRTKSLPRRARRNLPQRLNRLTTKTRLLRRCSRSSCPTTSTPR